MSWLSQGLGNLTGGMFGDKTAAQQTTATQSALYGEMAKMYQQYFPDMFKHMQGLAADPYSLSSGSMLGAYNDKVATQGQNAVNTVQADLNGRGFTGSNSLTPSVVGQMRQQQASDLGNYGRNLGVESANTSWDRYGQLASLLSGQGFGAGTGLSDVAKNENISSQIQGSDMQGIAKIIAMFMGG